MPYSSQIGYSWMRGIGRDRECLLSPGSAAVADQHYEVLSFQSPVRLWSLALTWQITHPSLLPTGSK